MDSAAFSRRTLLLSLAGIAVAGCSRTPQISESSSPSQQPSSVPTPVMELTSDGNIEDLRPDDVLHLSISDGRYVEAFFTQSDGVKVPASYSYGQISPRTGRLKVRHDYTLTVKVKDAAGQIHSQDFSLSTIDPELVCEVSFRYADSDETGNGMPIWINFDMPVAEDQRAAIEKTCTVTTSPVQEGSFGWIDEHTLQWRPKEYWQPNSIATVSVNAAGLPVADTWVLDNAEGQYRYGDLHVLKADIDSHTLTCYNNGEIVKVIPVSMGKPGMETMTGTKLIMEKERTTIMDSETFGVRHNEADGYRLAVKWAMRITWSGEYFHAAPWADADHGFANVSHGCTGMTDANAEWLFNFAKVGDPAEFTGSTFPVKPEQTFGCWVYSWDEWKKLSALV